MKANAHGAAAGGRLLATLAAFLCAACDHYQGAEHRPLDTATALGLSDPELRHPLHFAAKRQSLDIEVLADADGLSPNQHIEVVRFLEPREHEAKSRLVIFVPRAARPAAVARSLQDIQRHVADAGISYRIIKMTAWERGPNAVASIRLAYERPIAIAPPCADWGEAVGHNEEAVPYPNWGCATVHNLAVMVDNPRDPSVPQPEHPRAGERPSQSWPSDLCSAGKAGAAGVAKQ